MKKYRFILNMNILNMNLLNMNLLNIISFFLLLPTNSQYLDTQCRDITDKPQDRRQDKTKLRLMQYNVEWFFLDYYSGSDCPGNGCSWKNESESEIHLNYIYKTVHKLNPDIINFCEIEGCDELNSLRELLNNNYNSYLIKGTDSATGQNVGMLTKIDPLKSLTRSENKESYPLNNSKCDYNGNPSTTGVSKHYISEFKINNINICLISAHLIAIPTESSRCSKREAQASVLQGIIQSYVSRNFEIIMMGDFNDFDDEVLDVNNNVPNSKVLEILKGHWGTYKNYYELTSVASLLKQEKRFSDWYDSDNNCNTKSKNDYSMIDHILVTKTLFDKIQFVDIYHGYKEYCGKYNSDHYPVMVDFLF